MRIPSGKTDQRIYFVAFSSSDGSRLTGLSGFTVYRSRNGAAEVAYTTPTITEIDATNMPGVYALLVDEDTTIASTSDSEEYCLQISVATMEPVTRTIELYRRDTTSGQTLTVSSGNGNAAVQSIAANAITATSIASNAITSAKIATDAIGSAQLATTAVDEIVDAVWDETLTGSNHNIATSAGRRLREISSGIVTSGTAQAGSTTSITLASGASSVDGTYDPALVRISGGTGSGQSRLIINYVGSTRVATVDRDWRTAPDNTSTYEIIASPNLVSINEGLAQGGGADTITLNADASNVDDTYVGQSVWIRVGTGQDQVRVIKAYNGTTKVATVQSPWEIAPDSTSGYLVVPYGRAQVVSINADVEDELANVILDQANGIETGLTPRQAWRVIAAACAGKASGLGTNTAIYRNAQADSKDRITATVDADGNRPAVTLDVS